MLMNEVFRMSNKSIYSVQRGIFQNVASPWHGPLARFSGQDGRAPKTKTLTNEALAQWFSAFCAFCGICFTGRLSILPFELAESHYMFR
jgi:hypothetical protein